MHLLAQSRWHRSVSGTGSGDPDSRDKLASRQREIGRRIVGFASGITDELCRFARREVAVLVDGVGIAIPALSCSLHICKCSSTSQGPCKGFTPSRIGEI
jgi:hypothetical protein